MFVEALNTETFQFIVPVPGGFRKVQKDYKPVQRELQRLVQDWFDSGPNVAKLFSVQPSVARAALDLRAHLIPSKTGRAHLITTTVSENLPPGAPLEVALGLFFNFLINPENDKLGGPCKRCSKYYVKKTKRQIAYCSKKCGLKHTSKAAIRKKREDEHSKQLQKAERFSDLWSVLRLPRGGKSGSPAMQESAKIGSLAP
jgi:hypothetical protein